MSEVIKVFNYEFTQSKLINDLTQRYTVETYIILVRFIGYLSSISSFYEAEYFAVRKEDDEDIFGMSNDY